MSDCSACGNTGLVPVENGTVLARCKCQSEFVTILRTQLEAHRAVAKDIFTWEGYSARDQKRAAALRAAGIEEE